MRVGTSAGFVRAGGWLGAQGAGGVMAALPGGEAQPSATGPQAVALLYSRVWSLRSECLYLHGGGEQCRAAPPVRWCSAVDALHLALLDEEG